MLQNFFGLFFNEHYCDEKVYIFFFRIFLLLFLIMLYIINLTCRMLKNNTMKYNIFY